MLLKDNLDIFTVISTLHICSTNSFKNNYNIVNQRSYFKSFQNARTFKSSFETGIFPDKLKIAKIVPIFKSGDKTLVSNYRLIYVLSFFSFQQSLGYCSNQHTSEKKTILIWHPRDYIKIN